MGCMGDHREGHWPEGQLELVFGSALNSLTTGWQTLDDVDCTRGVAVRLSTLLSAHSTLEDHCM